MKEKLKNINLTSIINVLKASLIGVVISILLVLLFAFVLKFVNASSSIISVIDQIIKIFSVFAAIVFINKISNGNLLVKGLVVGALYSVITFIVFSILNGGVNFSIAIFTDIIFSALVGGTSAILLNIIRKK